MTGTISSQSFFDPPSVPRELHGLRRHQAGDDPAHEAPADGFGDDACHMRVRELPRVGLCDRERDRQERHAEAVVQPALDVEPLADARWQAGARDDSLAECRVGWRQDDGNDQRFCPSDAVEQECAHDRSGHDREREPDGQEAGGNPILASQDVQVDT